MRYWLSLVLFGLCLYPTLVWSCPSLGIGQYVPPTYGLYPSNVTFVPACADQPQVEDCSPDVPYLTIKGGFVDKRYDLGYSDSTGKAEVWVGVWLEGSPKMHRLKVKVTGYPDAPMVNGVLKIKERKGFRFSEGGLQTKTLKVYVLDLNNDTYLRPRLIRPGTKSFRRWSSEESMGFSSGCASRSWPPDSWSVPTSIAAASLAAASLPAASLPAASLPVVSAPAEPPFSLEQWLAAHQGERLAAQLSALMLLVAVLALRRARSRFIVTFVGLAGGVVLSALMFWSVARSLPIYARDLVSAQGDAYPLSVGASFGLMIGALAALYLAGRLTALQTPSRDLAERRLFQAAGWLSVSALGSALWLDYLPLTVALLCSAMLSTLLCLRRTQRKRAWLNAVKAGNLEGLQVAPVKEHPSDTLLMPALYHPREVPYDLVVLQVSAADAPYRREERPLWLTSSDPRENEHAVNRTLLCYALLGLYSMLALLYVLLVGSMQY